MKAVIMAGGKGTRIASIANDIPKPMIRICGKPILEHQIECLKRNGLVDITLVIGHLGHFIREYFGDGSSFGVHISYFEETEPLGTAGALFKMPELTEDFLLLCGDTVFDIDFSRLISFHVQKKAWATLVSHPNGHPYDSSLLVTETLPPQEEGGLPVDTKRVVRWMNKEDERLWYKNRVNAGIEVISPKLLDAAKKTITSPKIDLDRDVLKPFVPQGNIFAYDTPEYIKDMGTPDRYYQVEKDLSSGLVSQRNLSHKQKAVFLDRDGTLTREAGFITDIHQLELIPGTSDAIKKVNLSGYLAIVITNQPVIARGDVTFEQLSLFHDKIETLLGRDGAYLDAIYFCPHHPDKGFKGERPEYKKVCNCRKPAPGLFITAAKEFNIDLAQSYMIGDRDNDVLAGNNSGCAKSFLLTNETSLNKIVDQIIDCK